MHCLARSCALAAALLGGMCWVAHLFVEAAALWWSGAVLLAAAAFVLGALTARIPFVAATAGLGSVVLGWAVLALARDLGEARAVEGVAGACAALLVGIAVLVGAPPAAPVTTDRAQAAAAPRRGNHRG